MVLKMKMFYWAQYSCENRFQGYVLADKIASTKLKWQQSTICTHKGMTVRRKSGAQRGLQVEKQLSCWWLWNNRVYITGENMHPPSSYLNPPQKNLSLACFLSWWQCTCSHTNQPQQGRMYWDVLLLEQQPQYISCLYHCKNLPKHSTEQLTNKSLCSSYFPVVCVQLDFPVPGFVWQSTAIVLMHTKSVCGLPQASWL